jgi:hypothetical protein
MYLLPPVSHPLAQPSPSAQFSRPRRPRWTTALALGIIATVVSALASPASADTGAGIRSAAASADPAMSSTTSPSGDTYVDSRYSATNYGTATRLRSTSSVDRAFLRFDTGGSVPSGDVITVASLRIYVTTNAATTGGFEVHPEADTWTEGDVTWDNQPPWNSAIATTSTTPSAGSWLTIDLPGDAINSSGDTSLGLRYTVPNSNASFASREDPVNAPQLVISYAPADATSTLAASADTFVNANVTSANYGGADPVATSPNTKRALLRFATSGTVPEGSALVSAVLTVFVTAMDTAGTGFEVHPEPDTWSETQTSWSDQPAWNSTVLATSDIPVGGAWLSIPLPTGAISNSGNTSLGLRYTVAGSNAYFASRENSVNGPRLILTWAPAPTVVTGSLSNRNATTGTLNGAVNPNGTPTVCHFEYGTTSDYGTSTASDTTPGSGVSAMSVLADLTGLAADTTYHYRLSCSNDSVTAVGTDATFTTDPADVLQQKGLIYGSEIGGWLTGGRPATDASTGIPGKVVAAGVPVIRYEARDCFTDEVCGRNNHVGTLSRSSFDDAIVAITSSMHAIPFIKLLPVSVAGSTFCPDKNVDLTLANPTLNLPIYESMLAEIANGSGYHGPIIIESSNEMEYDCAAHWFGAGASAGLAGVSTLIGEHYAANMPALVKYARDTLRFSQVVSVGYIGVSGGGYGSITNGWGANCTANATAPYGYACGYRRRAVTEFNTAVLAAYHSNGDDPDYIPDVESIHAYCHSTDFVPTSFTPNAYDFDDNVCYSFYRNWIVKSRAYVNAIWGPTIGNNIRFSISEWQAGACATTTNCWTGFSSPSAVQSYYDGWYRMLRGNGNTAGTGTRYWSANLFAIASFTDTDPNGAYNLVRQDGTTPPWYDTFRSMSTVDPLR